MNYINYYIDVCGNKIPYMLRECKIEYNRKKYPTDINFVTEDIVKKYMLLSNEQITVPLTNIRDTESYYCKHPHLFDLRFNKPDLNLSNIPIYKLQRCDINILVDNINYLKNILHKNSYICPNLTKDKIFVYNDGTLKLSHKNIFIHMNNIHDIKAFSKKYYNVRVNSLEELMSLDLEYTKRVLKPDFLNTILYEMECN